MTMYLLIKKSLEQHGYVEKYDIANKILLIFVCRYCGKVITASTVAELFTNSSRHLIKHGVEVEMR